MLQNMENPLSAHVEPAQGGARAAGRGRKAKTLEKQAVDVGALVADEKEKERIHAARIEAKLQLKRHRRLREKRAPGDLGRNRPTPSEGLEDAARYSPPDERNEAIARRRQPMQSIKATILASAAASSLLVAAARQVSAETIQQPLYKPGTHHQKFQHPLYKPGAHHQLFQHPLYKPDARHHRDVGPEAGRT